jgi:hypothetical protein
MHTLILDLFKKRGIGNIAELKPEERQTFEQWNAILSDDITVPKLRNFCVSQLDLIKTQLRNTDNPYNKNERLVLLQNVYGTLLDVIDAPVAEKTSLERYLQDLLQQ